MQKSSDAIYLKLKEEAASCHLSYNFFDRTLISGECQSYDSLDDLKEHLKNGRFRIKIGNEIFDCFYHGVSHPKWLYVVYSGAVSKEWLKKKEPLFVRWGYYPMVEYLESAILCIADPMIQIFDGLRLGWFYGDAENGLIESSVTIVKSVCDHSRILMERCIFFSSSGGGYASIYAASLMEKALAVAINPQIYIQSYNYAQSFQKITGFDLNKKDPLHRNELAYMIRGSSSKFCIIFNIESEEDIRYHAIPLCEELGIIPEYGKISEKGNVMLWFYDAKGNPNPHKSQETREIFFAIDWIAKKFHEGILYEETQEIVLSVTELWHLIYEQIATCVRFRDEALSPCLLRLPNCPMQMGAEQIVFQKFNLEQKASNSDTHYLAHELKSHTLYSVSVHALADFDAYTICVYDFRKKRRLLNEQCSTGQEVKIHFVTGDIVEGTLGFLVYTGIVGRTKGHVLFLRSITVMALPLEHMG